MAKHNTSVAEDQEGRSLLVNKEGEPGQSELSPKTVPEPPRPPQSSIPPSTKGGAGALPPMLNTRYWIVVEWPDMMEEALNSSSIVVEYCALMGVVLHSIWSVNNRLKEAFGDLLTGLEVSNVIFFS